jgi:peptidoglycan/LPS O-acetylase OafA/YrhL
MGGVLAYATYKRRAIFPARLWIPAIVLLWPLAIVTRRITPPINEWLLCLLLGFSIPLFRQMQKGAVVKGAALVARYSYAIYLSHQPLLWLCFRRVSAPPGIRWAAFAIVSVLLPVLLYHVVEAPMIRLGKRLAGSIA